MSKAENILAEQARLLNAELASIGGRLDDLSRCAHQLRLKAIESGLDPSLVAVDPRSLDEIEARVIGMREYQ